MLDVVATGIDMGDHLGRDANESKVKPEVHITFNKIENKWEKIIMNSGERQQADPSEAKTVTLVGVSPPNGFCSEV
jgi:hypothetical protein